ncbi:MAG: cytochrome c biogenesis protein CcdA [Ilumatobacteraceae bacterium]
MGLLVAVIALYGAGVAGSISPCVLPLLPGYIGVLADGGADGRVRRTLLFCAGAITTFVVLGAVVAALGGSVSFTAAAAQRLAGAGLLVLGALAWASARGWHTPTWRLTAALPADAGRRAVMLGVGCAAAWSPCVGPLLGAALTAAGGSGSVARGAALLAAFGAGVVTPLIALSLLPAPRVPRRLRVMGRVLSRATPAMLAVVGLLLLTGAYETAVQRLAIPT